MLTLLSKNIYNKTTEPSGPQKNLVLKHLMHFKNLPYWQAFEFFSVDIMHNIFLGLYKDFATQYIQVPASGKELESEREKMEFSNRKYDVQLPPPATPSPPQTDDAAATSSMPPPQPPSRHSYDTRSSVSSNLHRDMPSSAGSDHTIRGKNKKNNGSDHS